MRISVIGGSSVDDETASRAQAAGREFAERGHTVVRGGLAGVMRAACRGASEVGGETVGIVPMDDAADANRFVTTPIATGMGHARNALVVLNGGTAIAIDGGPGTLSEIGLARASGRPFAALAAIADSERLPELDGVVPCDSPAEAIDAVERRV